MFSCPSAKTVQTGGLEVSKREIKNNNNTESRSDCKTKRVLLKIVIT